MYITQSDIMSESIDYDTLVQLTDKGDSGTVDDTSVDNAITAACGEIDDLLRARYQVPFITVPVIVRTIALHLTAHKLYGLNKGFPRPETVKDDFNNSMKLLTQISTGGIKLGVPSSSGDIPAAPTDTGILVSAPERRFGTETMSSY